MIGPECKAFDASSAVISLRNNRRRDVWQNELRARVSLGSADGHYCLESFAPA
jgi:hypothetical protein